MNQIIHIILLLGALALAEKELFATVLVAVSKGDIQNLKDTIQNGSDVNKLAHGGESALNLAAFKCNKE